MLNRSILLIIILLFLVSCATTNFNVLQKESKTNTQHFCSSPFEVELINENKTHKAVLNFEFQDHNNYHSWFITASGLNGQSFDFKTNRIQFYVDDQVFDLCNPILGTNSQYHNQKEMFFLNEKFFKKIVCCDKILMHMITDEGEFNTVLSKQAIEDIGIFYQFIKINVIDNISVVIR